eukprot:216558-Pyramimonas_sp.AAC.1
MVVPMGCPDETWSTTKCARRLRLLETLTNTNIVSWLARWLSRWIDSEIDRSAARSVDRYLCR